MLNFIPIFITAIRHINNTINLIFLFEKLCFKFGVHVFKEDFFFAEWVNLLPNNLIPTNTLIKLVIRLLKSLVKDFYLFVLVGFYLRVSNTLPLSIIPFLFHNAFLYGFHLVFEFFLNLVFFFDFLFEDSDFAVVWVAGFLAGGLLSEFNHPFTKHFVFIFKLFNKLVLSLHHF